MEVWRAFEEIHAKVRGRGCNEREERGKWRGEGVMREQGWRGEEKKATNKQQCREAPSSWASAIYTTWASSRKYGMRAK